MINPDSKGPAIAIAAPSSTALAISSALDCPARRSSKATAITPMHKAMVRSSPTRNARRGATGASSPIQSTGNAVVRLIRLRLNASSSAIRSISGAREVMPGRRLIAATTSASNSRALDGTFNSRFPLKNPTSWQLVYRAGNPSAGAPQEQAR
ncbi:hypothetical protein D3C80_1200630 [compost metagenome]